MSASMPTKAISRARVVALLSTDDRLLNLVRSVVEPPWCLEHHFFNNGLIGLLHLPDVRLLIVDDETVTEGDRGWLLGRIHRYLDEAVVLYIAATHSAENERRARSNGADYYTAKPIQNDDLAAILKAFMTRLQ
jgi:DNA-binding NtrC family response regulator